MFQILEFIYWTVTIFDQVTDENREYNDPLFNKSWYSSGLELTPNGKRNQ